MKTVFSLFQSAYSNFTLKSGTKVKKRLSINRKHANPQQRNHVVQVKDGRYKYVAKVSATVCLLSQNRFEEWLSTSCCPRKFKASTWYFLGRQVLPLQCPSIWSFIQPFHLQQDNKGTGRVFTND